MEAPRGYWVSGVDSVLSDKRGRATSLVAGF